MKTNLPKVIPSQKQMKRKNLDVLLLLQTSIMLTERKIKFLNKTNPIDAFLEYEKLLDVKDKFEFIKRLIKIDTHSS
jgi:hypothetical protein